MRRLLPAALAAACLVAGAARADPGNVDWQQGSVRCTGSGAPNLRDADGNPGRARIGAEKAARLDALRSCLETLRGTALESGKTVGGAMASDAVLTGRVQGLVKGFKVVGKPRYFSDGGVELDVEVPLEGALSDALLPRPAAAPAAAPLPADPEPPTSLVVDARGQKLLPALAPRVLDEAGAELYGPASLGEAGRRAGGGAAYAPDLEIAKRVIPARLGARPLVVKALRAEGADVVLSAADAAALRQRNLAVLAEARVVFLSN